MVTTVTCHRLGSDGETVASATVTVVGAGPGLRGSRASVILAATRCPKLSRCSESEVSRRVVTSTAVAEAI